MHPPGTVSERDRQILRALAARIDSSDAAAHNNLGVLYFNKRMLQDALEQFGSALAIDGSLRVARRNFAHALRALGRAAEADRQVALLEQEKQAPIDNSGDKALAIRRIPEVAGAILAERTERPTALPGTFLAFYHRGVAHRERGEYREALRAFEDAIAAGEQRDLVEQAMAEVLLVDGRAAEAADLYDALLARNPNSPKLWNERGVCHHVLGVLDSATRCYTRALSLDAEYALAENNIAVAHANKGDDRAASDTMESIVARGGGFSEALCNLGLLALQRGRTADAVAAYRRATTEAPERPAGWLGLAAALAEQGGLAAARNAIVRGVDLAPESAEARYRLAFILNRLGDVRGSLEETRKALAIDPYFTAPRLVLAIELQFEYSEVHAPDVGSADRVATAEPVAGFQLLAGDVGAAIARLREGDAARGAAGNSGAGKGRGSGFQRAVELMARGALPQALAEIRRVVLAGGDSIEGAILSGEALQRQGLDGEALERFDAAAARLEGQGWDSRHTRAWVGRGGCLLALGRVAEAGDVADTLAVNAPTEGKATSFRAEALLATGAAGKAYALLSQLADEDPADAAVLVRLAVAARRAGRLDLARRVLRDALALDPDLAFARLELGSLHLAEGEFDEAAEQGRAALSALPGYAEAARLVADAERAAGRAEAAIAVLAELLEEDAYHLPSLLYLGQMLLHTGRAGDARVAFRRVLRLSPESGDAWLGLSRSYLAEGRANEAAACRAQAAAIPGGRLAYEPSYSGSPRRKPVAKPANHL